MLVILMSIVILGTGASIGVSLVNRDPSTNPNQGCHTSPDTQDAAKTAIGWEGLFLFDLLLFSMTVRKAYQMRRESEVNTGKMGGSLFSVVVRDGSIYFFIMALANLVNIITFYIPGPFLKGTLAPFAGCLSVTLMSRLMLNLHEAANGGLYVSYSDTLPGPISH
ncbi:hypothetical protein BT96DRAFT_291426 [Gymnopus androsaceus JB14]|uniref:Uncharacterized protein n=1 Tax=Gymnopus androsaceus JB14 TaxID=1447944 RepID=A0A6A4H2H2_9AGAR|nr:hypothetical protein BT96DRAFT_291426 [Gymnopus androsaceus JB14]